MLVGLVTLYQYIRLGTLGYSQKTKVYLYIGTRHSGTIKFAFELKITEISSKFGFDVKTFPFNYKHAVSAADSVFIKNDEQL